MTNTLTQALQLVISIFRAMVDFIFETPYPGFTVVTIGAVAIGLLMISFGFDYLDFFLGHGNDHIKEDKK